MSPGDQARKKAQENPESASAQREGASILLKAYESFVPDFVRKTVLLGLGSVSMTEESVRRVLAELRLPREEAKRLYDYLLDQSQKSKSEVLNLVGVEFKSFLKTLNLEDELRRVLAEMRIRVQADITFERKQDGAVAPLLEFRFGAPAAEPQGPAPAEAGDGSPST